MCCYPCQSKQARDGGLWQSYFFVVLSLTQPGAAVHMGVVHITTSPTKPGQC